MNPFLKNMLAVTLVATASVAVPAQAAVPSRSVLQATISGLATTSPLDIVNAYIDVLSEAIDVYYPWLCKGTTLAIKGATAVVTTTPRDVYRFVSHPDTLAVLGVTAAGYALYKYMSKEKESSTQRVTHCSRCEKEALHFTVSGAYCQSCYDNAAVNERLEAVNVELAQAHAELSKINTQLQATLNLLS